MDRSKEDKDPKQLLVIILLARLSADKDKIEDGFVS
jgi:hypothetical protein